MSPLAQQLVAYAVVLVAAGWLLRRWTLRRRERACDKCGVAAGVDAPPRGKGVRPSSLRVLR